MVKIKICGMRRTEDIVCVNKYRPDYVGFILSEGFRRTISEETFCELSRRLDSGIMKVGVFVNEPVESLLRYADRLDVVQLHGEEDGGYIKKVRSGFNGEIWKAVRACSAEDIEKADKLDCDKLLIDSYVKGKVGGTGRTADLDIILRADFSKEFFLAGGIDSNNVCRAVEKVGPLGVDLSSSVETDGWKDENKIKEIIGIIRRI